MDVFLKRQDVRKRMQWGRKLRQVERALLSMFVVVVGLAALYGLYRLVFLGNAFAVEKVIVEGNWRILSGDQIALRSGVTAGDNLFWISMDEVHDRLDGVPWTKDVTVRRRLPDTLNIYVEEFVPAAIIASNDFYFVDGEGTIIKKAESGEDKDLPVLSGITVSGEGELTDDGRERLMEMLEILGAFNRSRFGRDEGVAELNYDRIEGYSIITRKNPMQILIGRGDTAGRIRRIGRMVNAMTAGRPPIRYMIANENGRVIVRYRPS